MKRYFTPCPKCSTPERPSVEFRARQQENGIITCCNCGFQEQLIEIKERIFKVIPIDP